MSGSVSLVPDPAQGVVWRRLWAWLIDLLLIGVTVAVLWAVMFLLGVVTLGLGFGLMALLPAVPLAYHILFVAGPRAATPGQSMLGLVVLRDGDLGRPGVFEAVVFTGGLWLTVAVAMPLLAVALFTERNRALHDIVSGLVVLRREGLTNPLTNPGGSANIASEMPPR